MQLRDVPQCRHARVGDARTIYKTRAGRKRDAHGTLESASRHQGRAVDRRGTRLDNVWLAVRRPLLVALVLGCATSLMTSGRLTLRLLVPAAVYWSFIPVLEVAGLWAVGGKRLDAKTI